MNEKYEVQNIIKFWNKFRNKKIHLFGRKYRFLINIRNGTLPHLLGLQYINSNSSKLIGLDLYNYIKNNNLSDDKIYALINKNNPTKLMFVKKRIETFISFWENIENSYIVEKTTQFSHIKSKLLLVQSNKSSFLQLGLKQINNKKYVLETYFVELDDKYFSNSKSMDKVIEIEETTNKGISKPFSFKNEKQVLANVLNKQKMKNRNGKIMINILM
ncbi:MULTISPECIES: hypothetical protein [unclassified Fusobacterium]|uniref:hypothetical protein n=1 Tax=unclassified Fusobacterium TaxID=2648384 RepID=UPI001B8B9AD8|nr:MULTISPECIES: hypothetical protein [unclassified Fusobacterium]MBR8700473.1 hypothetical protein [Fusobacterium sp. DD45]MBR8710262.1 hypothetical protein [Fusobacterium sp. DD28]MBR8750784.1 hypothetical protein [Fusobacterium sp. DD26]